MRQILKKTKAAIDKLLDTAHEARDWQGVELLDARERMWLYQAFRRVNTTGEDWERRLRDDIAKTLIYGTVLSIEQVDADTVIVHTYGGGKIVVCADD